MAAVSLAIIIMCLLLNFLGILFRSYRFGGEKIAQKVKHMFMPGAAVLLSVYDRIRKYFTPWREEEEREIFSKLYIGEDISDKRRIIRLENINLSIIILVLSAVVSLMISKSELYDVSKIDYILRPDSGSSSADMTIQYGGEEIPISVEVSQVYPSENEMIDTVREVSSSLEKIILGENESLSHIVTNLNLVNQAENPLVTISWNSSDGYIVGTTGTVHNEELYDAADVIVTATIKYFEYEEKHDFSLKVYPASESSKNTAYIKNYINELMEKSKYDKKVELPDKVNDDEISFYTVKDNNEWVIPIIGLIVSVLMIPLGIEKRKNKMEERNKQLIIDYPEVISKFTLLLEAGNTVRGSFERTALDYEKRKKKSKKVRYVYEEMLRTKNEIKIGRAESECYEEMGKRCGNMYYIRFASLLSQSVKLGGENLIPQLRKEVTEVFKERQSAIRKKGEETSVKLLIPMAGMFIIVILIIMIPAFMTMQM